MPFDEDPAGASLFLLSKGGMQGILGKFSPGIGSAAIADEVVGGIVAAADVVVAVFKVVVVG